MYAIVRNDVAAAIGWEDTSCTHASMVFERGSVLKCDDKTFDKDFLRVSDYSAYVKTDKVSIVDVGTICEYIKTIIPAIKNLLDIFNQFSATEILECLGEDSDKKSNWHYLSNGLFPQMNKWVLVKFENEEHPTIAKYIMYEDKAFIWVNEAGFNVEFVENSEVVAWANLPK